MCIRSWLRECCTGSADRSKADCPGRAEHRWPWELEGETAAGRLARWSGESCRRRPDAVARESAAASAAGERCSWVEDVVDAGKAQDPVAGGDDAA